MSPVIKLTHVISSSLNYINPPPPPGLIGKVLITKIPSFFHVVFYVSGWNRRVGGEEPTLRLWYTIQDLSFQSNWVALCAMQQSFVRSRAAPSAVEPVKRANEAAKEWKVNKIR